MVLRVHSLLYFSPSLGLHMVSPSQLPLSSPIVFAVAKLYFPQPTNQRLCPLGNRLSCKHQASYHSVLELILTLLDI